MAPPFSFFSWRTEVPQESKTMVVYLVRSLGLMPESTSHDWHVQPSCQRPNRDPPERREFSPGESARKQIRLSSKLVNHTVRRKSRQSTLPTEFPDDFHNENSGAGELPAKPRSRFLTGLSARLGMTRLLGAALAARNSMVFRSGGNANFGVHFRQPDTEDKKLRKDPFGGPCFEGTLRKRL